MQQIFHRVERKWDCLAHISDERALILAVSPGRKPLKKQENNTNKEQRRRKKGAEKLSRIKHR